MFDIQTYAVHTVHTVFDIQTYAVHTVHTVFDIQTYAVHTYFCTLEKHNIMLQHISIAHVRSNPKHIHRIGKDCKNQNTVDAHTK